MTALDSLLEKLLEDRTREVPDAGLALLDRLSGSQLGLAEFLDDPQRLTAPPFLAPRYLAQVTLRAVRGEYDTTDELAGRIKAFLDRKAPTLEPRGDQATERTLIPEARVVELRQPARRESGVWDSGVIALVTSGPLRGREIEIRVSSEENRYACFLVSCMWLHAAIAVYNLESVGENLFAARPETFFVIEPLRQINVTSIARSLHCIKPQVDQFRRGKGDATIQTVRGTVVHAIFDRMLEGARDIETLYDEILPHHKVQLASIVDEFFDEGAFRSEVLRHLTALQVFIDANAQILKDPQIELKRYSSTLGIQGRIDAMFRRDQHLDILELKTGSRVRTEDHAQLFIYRLLLSDLVRRWQRSGVGNVDISARLLSSTDGAYAPLQIQTDFQQVMDARNRLIAGHYALSLSAPHFKMRYEGFNEDVCRPCPSWTRERCRETTTLYGDRPGAEETPELQYFRKFTRLIERERWAAEQDLVELLDDSLLDARRKNFRCLTDAQLVETEPNFTFAFEDNTSDFAAGDSVLIHSGNISSTAIFHGQVRGMETQRIRISIPLKNLSPSVFSGQRWIIDRYPSDVTSEASHTALYDYLTAGGLQPTATLRWSGQDPDPFPGDRSRTAHTLHDRHTEFAMRQSRGPTPPIPAGFNESQRKAIQRSVICSRYHLVWGPPGTGKTKVIPEIVRRIDGRVLLGAFTNTAVDKMLMALLSADPQVRFLRIGRASESPELASMLPDPSEYFSDDLARKSAGIHDLRQAMDAAPIVAATAHRACTLSYLRRRPFEMAVVDEAGQLTEPLTLGLILRARRFVLIGDDRQLPPVVRTRELGHSMFERLKRQAERESGSTLTLLDTQYRMHPRIMDLSNKLFYDGRLRTGVSAEERLAPEGGPVLMVPVEGPTDGRTNAAEAAAVESLVRRYCGEFAVPGEAIGVVSPFRAQVVLMRKQLHDTGVAVDTVERFQGGERDIMILSLVRSEGSGFVFDERRLNVAITRARRKLVLVAHPNLFRNSKYEWLASFGA